MSPTQTTNYTVSISDVCGEVVEENITIAVLPLGDPVFDAVPTICAGDIIDPLPTTSNNGISGTWSPNIDNTATTTYVFTPNNIDICAEEVSLQIVVVPKETPAFDVIAAICEGDDLAALPTTSNNRIEGTWSPSLNNLETTTYTFTPSENACAFSVSIKIIVNKKEMPIFDIINNICEGQSLPVLPIISNNGISGMWSPAPNAEATTTYVFTPLDTECALENTTTIVVNPVFTPIFDAVDSICAGDFLAELPTTSNNGISGTWSPELNNTVSTTYTFTPEASAACFTETMLQIIVNELTVPSFDVVNPICEGFTIKDLPTVSNDAIEGTWSPALNNLETTIYTFAPQNTDCIASTTLEVEIIPMRVLFVEVEVISEPFSPNQTAMATVSGGTGFYEYQLDNGAWVDSNIFSGIVGCQDHIIRAREISRCSNLALASFQILEYPKFFTPNGDAVNDSWNIECLRGNADAKVTIFDRYGKIVAVINPSRYGWDGLYNNTPVPGTDYWFKAEFLGEDGLPKVFRSHFSVKY